MALQAAESSHGALGSNASCQQDRRPVRSKGWLPLPAEAFPRLIMHSMHYLMLNMKFFLPWTRRIMYDSFARKKRNAHMILHHPLKIALLTGLTFCLAGCGPLTASIHDPRSLPALEKDNRVHYEPDARAYAEAVARILPNAMEKIEAVQGAPFGSSFVLAVYADENAYAAANGQYSAKTNAATYFDRVTLSPRLWREEPDRLEAYLAHELSHEHLWSHLPATAYLRIPNWFQEGLAVMASDGGGAQRVSPQEAKAAIRAGQVIETPDVAELFNSMKPPAQLTDRDIYRAHHMAYRQAGMFVTYLRENNPAAFSAFMHRLLAGEPFKAAFESSFGSSVAQSWSSFAAAVSKS
jgi:hypothetical protein